MAYADPKISRVSKLHDVLYSLQLHRALLNCQGGTTTAVRGALLVLH
jgi:hypothetical protein